jgi:hypothetical protein
MLVYVVWVHFVGFAVVVGRGQSTGSLPTSAPRPTRAPAALSAPTNVPVAPTTQVAPVSAEPTDPTPTDAPSPTTPPEPTETAVPTAAPTTAPSPTSIPLPAPTLTPIPIIINYSTVLNSSVKDVEEYLGESSGEILPIKADEYPDELPGGGEARSYFLDDFDITVFYDKQGVAKVILMFGLEQYNYKMDDWPTVMVRLGFPVDSPPDKVAPIGRHWVNYKGYGISLQGGRRDGPIDFAKMFVVP